MTAKRILHAAAALVIITVAACDASLSASPSPRSSSPAADATATAPATAQPTTHASPQSTPTPQINGIPLGPGWMEPERAGSGDFDSLKLAIGPDGTAHVVVGGPRGLFYLTNTGGQWTSSRLVRPTLAGTCANHARPESSEIDAEGRQWLAYTPGCAQGAPSWNEGLFVLRRDASSWGNPEAVAGRYTGSASLAAFGTDVHLAYTWQELGTRPTRVFYGTRGSGSWAVERVATGLQTGSTSRSLAIGSDGLARLTATSGSEAILMIANADGSFERQSIPDIADYGQAWLGLDAADAPYVAWTDHDRGAGFRSLADGAWTTARHIRDSWVQGFEVDDQDRIHLLLDVWEPATDDEQLAYVRALPDGSLEATLLAPGTHVQAALALGPGDRPYAAWLVPVGPDEVELWVAVSVEDATS